ARQVDVDGSATALGIPAPGAARVVPRAVARLLRGLLGGLGPRRRRVGARAGRALQESALGSVRSNRKLPLDHRIHRPAPGPARLAAIELQPRTAVEPGIVRDLRAP